MIDESPRLIALGKGKAEVALIWLVGAKVGFGLEGFYRSMPAATVVLIVSSTKITAPICRFFL